MTYPSWRYGPNGEARIFDSGADVPEGWVDHPSGIKAVTQAPAKTGRKVKRRGDSK